jgi:4-azaleucine resistance transporter AzlC
MASSLIFGASFGILARAAGFGVVAPIVMSATTFGGSAQFAAVSVLGGGGAPLAAIVAAVLLNSRYLAIGLSVAPSMRGRALERGLIGPLVVDESWALANLGGGRYDVRILVAVGCLMFAGWVGGTAVGVFGGGALGDPARYGLDAAFPALFLALLVPQAKRSKVALQAAVLGGTIAFVLIPFTPPGVPIIAASAACLLGLRRG